MKQKKMSVKLTLNKVTVTNLKPEEMKVYGGINYTVPAYVCDYTLPKWLCRDYTLIIPCDGGSGEISIGDIGCSVSC